MSRFVGSVAACLLLSGGVGALFAQDTRPYLSEADQRVFAALDETTELDVENQSLREVAEYLGQRHRINVQLDDFTATNPDIGAETTVTVRLQQVSLRTGLRMMLDKIGLTYAVQDGYLLITAPETCPRLTRIYPVGDLVTPNRDLLSPTTDQSPSAADFRVLVDIVEAWAAPTSWDEVGGPGAIEIIAVSQALAIAQTEEVHEEIVELFRALRRTRDKQVAAAADVVRLMPAADQRACCVKVYRLAAVNQTSSQQNQPSHETNASAGANAQLAERAKDIADFLPKAVAPDSWHPTGKGTAHSLANTIVVRQTEEVHEQIARLLSEIIPDEIGPLPPTHERTVRLAVPGPQRDWPQSAEPPLDEVTAAIDKSLDQEVDLQFQDTRLAGVIKAISESYHVQITVDQKALREVDVTLDTPITCDLPGLTLRAALRLIVHDLDLAYVFRNDSVCITSIPCDEMLTSKVYPVFDLVVRPPHAPAAGKAIDFQPLIHLLTTIVSPSSWDEVGGPGEITIFANGGALIVAQTQGVHDEIVELLKALREVGATEQEQ